MIENVIEKIIKEQKPYFLLQGKPIKGLNSQYWLIFDNTSADSPAIHQIIKLLGQSKFESKTKLIRIDATTGQIYNYALKKEGDIPYATILKTQALDIIEKFLIIEDEYIDKDLVEGSFLELKDNGKRRYSLPKDINEYKKFMDMALSRTILYRRSTGYFDSGVLKLYNEPLQDVIKSNGKIRILIDWQGFVDDRDLKELEKLQDEKYRSEFIFNTIEEFLKKLNDEDLTSAEVMAELIRLDFLDLRLIKMDDSKAIYHKKLGVLTDNLGNNILHEGSDNFTRAAYARNTESVTFLYSFDEKDLEIINQGIQEFDSEWENPSLTHKISKEFLTLVEKERKKRNIASMPTVDSIAPTSLKTGLNEDVKFKGKNLDKVDEIKTSDNDLIEVKIKSKSDEEINADIEVNSEHPPIQVNFDLIKNDTKIPTQPLKPVKIKTETKCDEYGEIENFKSIVEKLISGKSAGPKDFLYWLSKQRPQQFKIVSSEELDILVEEGTLFEHQKSGAQHCHRVINDFGVSVCADAVGLGKTRLAAAVAKLMNKERIAIIASRKFHPNWIKEMECLGFKEGDYELYNKNLMGRNKSDFITDFTRFGGPDFVVIDEAHEGIRNFKSKVHKTCLAIKNKDLNSKTKKQRHYLLLTATPWNNRREDIYNMLSPFLTKPEAFRSIGLPEVISYFEDRESGVELLTDDTKTFRKVYKELFLQRTRAMLKVAYPALNLYAKRIAKWLPVKFEQKTELALDQIFQTFEEELTIPFANPLRYFSEAMKTSSLPKNLKRFFLQRAESSMYALNRTIANFEYKIISLEEVLENISPTPDGLYSFLVKHYNLEEDFKDSTFDYDDADEDFIEDEEEEFEDKEDKRQKIAQAVNNAYESLKASPEKAEEIYYKILNDCEEDRKRLQSIKELLSTEFVVDHKRKVVTDKVKEIVSSGKKVLLISTFADTVLDYYKFMQNDPDINKSGIGMSIGGNKKYYTPENKFEVFPQNNYHKLDVDKNGIRREEMFRLFAPEATCRKNEDLPSFDEQIGVLIGSETLSVGQNLQDADILINIDLPWNPMILEQRIGRIDRPKKHSVQELNIYYANSESQLLRQASRLDTLHKKLVGEDTIENGEVKTISSMDDLSASIYGDTAFDDEVLPDYIQFLKSLSDARHIEQGNIQEKAFEKQDEQKDMVTQIELLYGEEISQLIKNLGENYKYNNVTLGRHTETEDEPDAIIGLEVEYFGPNGEKIPNKKTTILWNNKSGEKGAFSQAIKHSCSTPEATNIFASGHIKSCCDSVYKDLLEFKKQLIEKEIKKDETMFDIKASSSRLNKICSRIIGIKALKENISEEKVKLAIQNLNTWKHTKTARKILKEFTSKETDALDDDSFLKNFIENVENKNFIDSSEIQADKIKISIVSILLKA